ncbi:hypothetical protein M3J09_010323 [Ascochyta lentis]
MAADTPFIFYALFIGAGLILVFIVALFHAHRKGLICQSRRRKLIDSERGSAQPIFSAHDSSISAAPNQAPHSVANPVRDETEPQDRGESRRF